MISEEKENKKIGVERNDKNDILCFKCILYWATICFCFSDVIICNLDLFFFVSTSNNLDVVNDKNVKKK